MTSPSRPVLTLLLTLVAATACSSSTPKAEPQRSSAAPTASSSSAPAARSIVVAVLRRTSKLALYRIGADRHARLLRSVPAPNSDVPLAFDATLSSGPHPTLCGVWGAPEEDGADSPSAQAVACLAPGAATPIVVAQSPGGPNSTFPSAAVRADGQAVAWLDASYPPEQADLVTADWDGTSIHNTQRAVADPARPRGKNPRVFADPVGLAWAGPDTLAFIEWGGEGIVGLQTQQVNAASIRDGWMKGASLVSPHDKGFEVFDRVATADATSAYAVERDNLDPRPGLSRAVRVDLATGRVLDVIAVPAGDRYVAAVSGGASGAVYATQSLSSEVEDSRFYVRFPGEKHGLPILGLPADTNRVQAQN